MQQSQEMYYFFQVPDGADLDFKSVTLRRLRKRNEKEAGAWADALRDKHADPNFMDMFQLQVEQKMLLAMVAVDGVPVVHPFVEADNWTMPSWSYLQHAYNKVNGVDPKKLDSFGEQMQLVTTVSGTPDSLNTEAGSITS